MRNLQDYIGGTYMKIVVLEAHLTILNTTPRHVSVYNIELFHIIATIQGRAGQSCIKWRQGCKNHGPVAPVGLRKVSEL